MTEPEKLDLAFKGNPRMIDSVSKEDYEKLKASGMLWEIYPDAPDVFPS